MKKFLMAALNLMLVLAVFAVPMAVSATTANLETFDLTKDVDGSEDEVTGYIENYDVTLVVGDNTLVVDGGYKYNLYEFEPEQIGKYILTSTDSKIANVGGGWFFYQEPNEENVNSSTVVFECTSVGQSAIIAVDAETNTANITITREELETSDDKKSTVYENEFDVVDFVLPESIDEDVLLENYVDVADDVVDTAVLGDDGYYHLNNKNGPVLFVNLGDELMSLADMVAHGNVVANNVSYTAALQEYINALPKQTNKNGNVITDMWGNPIIASYWYPLTVDLMEIYKNVGAEKGWYDPDNMFWIGGDLDDAWMFACYYDADITTLGDAIDNNNNNDGNNTNTDTGANNSANSNVNSVTSNTGSANTNGTTSDSKSPSTGDNTVALAVVLISAAALVVASKKAKFNA